MEQILSLSDDKLADLFSDGHSRNRPPSARKLELEALVPDYVKRIRCILIMRVINKR